MGPIKDVVNTCIEHNTKYYGYNIKPLISNKNSILEFIDEYITDGNLTNIKDTVNKYISSVNSFALRLIIRGYISTNIAEDTYTQISSNKGNIINNWKTIKNYCLYNDNEKSESKYDAKSESKYDAKSQSKYDDEKSQSKDDTKSQSKDYTKEQLNTLTTYYIILIIFFRPEKSMFNRTISFADKQINPDKLNIKDFIKHMFGISGKFAETFKKITITKLAYDTAKLHLDNKPTEAIEFSDYLGEKIYIILGENSKHVISHIKSSDSDKKQYGFKNINTEYSENKKNDDILSVFECTQESPNLCLRNFLEEFCTLNKPNDPKIKCIADMNTDSKGGSEMIKNIDFIPDIAPGKDDFISVIKKNKSKKKKKMKNKKKISKQKRRTKLKTKPKPIKRTRKR